MPRNAIDAERRHGVPVRGALFIALAAASGTGFSQESPPAQLETVVVTGSRLEQPTTTSNAATLVNASQIDRLFKPNLPALLADLPGVFTNLPGSRGGVGELILRGGEPNFTAVLVDGIQVNDPTNTRGGSFDFSTLDMTEVERIELLRGPLSSIYGSDALSGIVNIVTHEPTDTLTSQARLVLGSDELTGASARIGGPLLTNSRFSVNAATRRDGRSDNSGGYRSESLSGKLELARRPESELTLHARRNRTEFHAFPDSSGGPLFALSSDQDQRRSGDNTLAATWRRALSDRAQLHLATTLFEHAEHVISPGVTAGPGGEIPANQARSNFSRRLLSIFINVEPLEQLSAAFGASIEQQKGRSTGSLEVAPGFSVPTAYALQRDTAALFGELAYELTDRLAFGAALRIDDSDTATQEATSKVSMSYAMPQTNTRLTLAWATGFKLPSLFSLGDALVGNPLLESETVKSWEIGIETGLGSDRFSIRATAFGQRFENLIDFDFEQFMSVNRDRVRTDGIEISARYRINDALSWTMHGTWLDIDVAGSNEVLRQRPRRHGGIGIEWAPAPTLTIVAGWRHVAERLDASIPTGNRKLASYGLANASLTWRINDSTGLQVAIDDVTDERFEDAIGFPSLGRRLRVSVSTELSGAR